MKDFKIFVEYRYDYGAFAVSVTTSKSAYMKLVSEFDDVVLFIDKGIAEVKKMESKK